MYKVIVVTNREYYGITEIEYKNIDKYKITDDFLILDEYKTGGSYYIARDHILEFKVDWQV